MITEDDRKAAEEHATLWYFGADGQKKSGGMNPTKYDSYLAGIEHEWKRREVVDALNKQAIAIRESGESPDMILIPVEQVGERHWRIKE